MTIIESIHEMSNTGLAQASLECHKVENLNSTHSRRRSSCLPWHLASRSSLACAYTQSALSSLLRFSMLLNSFDWPLSPKHSTPPSTQRPYGCPSLSLSLCTTPWRKSLQILALEKRFLGLIGCWSGSSCTMPWISPSSPQRSLVSSHRVDRSVMRNAIFRCGVWITSRLFQERDTVASDSLFSSRRPSFNAMS